ncbi:ABC transporter substrate-binding protein [Arthrobacter sp. MYb211]|uniref:glutamate ABC transporter substrate-binding protein n=1 Tax=Micrococcaceae TaxID=1268 RepID=UPI000BB7C095|nr:MULTISPECIES: glutamate ABC transporter substrate-binding protein [Micrococcaceae]PCC29442.1 ABC transporter substrate-binding protein [Glutamicibacter sp. BW80]PQZ99269.1 ABC transporter substrate-binding protein [Arthrobacter sp. MYb224]PRA06249.1 ABC transporter substrate-binding protein [Arthrobacter sp. MYb229]PRA12816.1 ABC transporter substrate-binding protein [Arthrobacter sp. MYb221]PRB53151.1 ABC transporter substrate-binding protein [Arthrobacter sp. MYb216]
MRKNRLGAVAAMAAVAALALTSCGGGSGEGDAESIRIGIKFDQPGLGFKDGNNYTGFDVDVAKYVANELGYAEENIEWVSAPSANRETMLQNDQVDMIFATYSITEERNKVVDFAGPYFVAGQDLLVATDSDIASPEDLNGKNLCSVTGSTSAQKVKDNYAENTNLQELPGYAECVTQMGGGTIDAVTTDDIILAGLAAQPAYQGKFKVAGAPFSEENYGVGLPDGTDKCGDINAAITKMIESGAWEEALTANTEGTGYTPNSETNPPELSDTCA